jgi:hypothetical protein
MPNVEAAVIAANVEDKLQKFICECEEEKTMGKGESCKKFGDRKHDCVDKKIEKHNETAKPGDMIGAERGYKDHLPYDDSIVSATEALPFKRKQIWPSTRSGSKWPDACSFDANGDPYKFFEFKFKCPTAKYSGPPPWGKGQKEKYIKLTKRLGNDPSKDKKCAPQKLDNTGCPGYKGKP